MTEDLNQEEEGATMRFTDNGVQVIEVGDVVLKYFNKPSPFTVIEVRDGEIVCAPLDRKTGETKPGEWRFDLATGREQTEILGEVVWAGGFLETDDNGYIVVTNAKGH